MCMCVSLLDMEGPPPWGPPRVLQERAAKIVSRTEWVMGNVQSLSGRGWLIQLTSKSNSCWHCQYKKPALVCHGDPQLNLKVPRLMGIVL